MLRRQPRQARVLERRERLEECRDEVSGKVCTSPPHTTTGAGASGTGGFGGFGTGGSGGGTSSNGGGEPSGGGGAGTGGSTSASCPGHAIAVDIGNDESVQGDTSSAADLQGGTCGGDGAPEVVYAVTPLTDGTLIATVTGTGATDAVIYARIEDCDAGPQIGCADATADGGVETLTLQATTNKTIYLFVDGFIGTSGSFALNLHLQDGVPGDTCPGNPIDLRHRRRRDRRRQHQGRGLAVQGGGRVRNHGQGDRLPGDARHRRDDHRDHGPRLRRLAYARSGTCTSSLGSVQVGCSDAGGMGGLEQISWSAVAGTAYSVFADGAGTSSGSYTITFRARLNLDLAPTWERACETEGDSAACGFMSERRKAREEDGGIHAVF